MRLFKFGRGGLFGKDLVLICLCFIFLDTNLLPDLCN